MPYTEPPFTPGCKSSAGASFAWNHLGSAAMEVDKEGKLISYEEYFPYGGTAFVVGKNQAEVKLRKV